MSKKIVIPTRTQNPPSADQWVQQPTPNGTVPREKPKRLTLDMEPDLHRRLKLYCVHQDQDIAAFLRQLIENALPSQE